MKTVILLAMFTPAFAWAGVGAHGGNVVSCQGQEPVTLDYYNASLPTMSGPTDLIDISAMSESQVFQLVRSLFDGSPLQDVFDQVTQQLGPIDNWILSDLKSIDDSDEPFSLPTTCQRLTAAARQDGIMYLDPDVYKMLKAPQVGLLIAHEVLYAMSNLDTSAPVREAFRELLRQKPDLDELNRLMAPIGKFAIWDWFRNDYKSNAQNPIPFAGTFDGISSSPQLVYRNDPDSDVIGWWDLNCSLSTQSCTITQAHQTTHGPLSDLIGCVVTVPHANELDLSCPSWNGQVDRFNSP